MPLGPDGVFVVGIRRVAAGEFGHGRTIEARSGPGRQSSARETARHAKAAVEMCHRNDFQNAGFVLSGCLPVQTGTGFWVGGEETAADGLLNECKRLLGFACLRFGCLRTELCSR